MKSELLKFTSSFLVSSVSFSTVGTAFADSANSQEKRIFKNKLIPLYLFSAAAGTGLLIFLVNSFSKPKKPEGTFTIQDAEARVEDTGNCPSPKKGSQKDTGSLPCNNGIDDTFESKEPEILDSSGQNKSLDSGENLPPLGQESSDPTTKQERKKRKKIANGNGKNNNKTSILKIFKSLIFNKYTFSTLLFFKILPQYIFTSFRALTFYTSGFFFIFIFLYLDLTNYLSFMLAKAFPSFSNAIYFLDYVLWLFLYFRYFYYFFNEWIYLKIFNRSKCVGILLSNMKNLKKFESLYNLFLTFAVWQAECPFGIKFIYNFFRLPFCDFTGLKRKINTIDNLVGIIDNRFPDYYVLEGKTLEEHITKIVEDFKYGIDFINFLENIEKNLKALRKEINKNSPVVRVIVLPPYYKINFKYSEEQKQNMKKILKEKEKNKNKNEEEIENIVIEIEKEHGDLYSSAKEGVVDYELMKEEDENGNTKANIKRIEDFKNDIMKDKDLRNLNEGIKCGNLDLADDANQQMLENIPIQDDADDI